MLFNDIKIQWYKNKQVQFLELENTQGKEDLLLRLDFGKLNINCKETIYKSIYSKTLEYPV